MQPRIPISAALLSGLGCSLSLLALFAIGKTAGVGLLVAPFGASAALLFALPHSPLSHPGRVLGAYALALVLGFGVLYGVGPSLLAACLVTGVLVSAMLLLDVLHAPAAGLPILMVLQEVRLSFALAPVLVGLLLLLGFALVFRRLRHWLFRV
jgi:CBS-domain-containing membrane protein